MRNKVRFVSQTHLHNMFCELIFVSNLCSCIFWCEILIGAHVTNIAFDYLGPWVWHWSWFVFLNLVQQCSAKTCLNLLPPKKRWRRLHLGKEKTKQQSTTIQFCFSQIINHCFNMSVRAQVFESDMLFILICAMSYCTVLLHYIHLVSSK